MRRYLANLVVALVASSAYADSRPMLPDAKVQLDKGIDKYNAHDYAAAIAMFDAGYAIDPHPDFLYVKAQAQRLSGDCRAAVVTYQAFLASEPPASEAEVARGNIAKCEQQLAAQKPHDGEHTAVPIGPIDDKDHATQVDKAGPKSQAEASPWSHDGVGIALGIGGAVAFGVSGLAAWRAQVNADAATKANGIDDWVVARDAWTQDKTIAQIAAGVGGALVLGSIIRFAWASQQTQVTTAAVPSRGGGMLVVGGNF